MTKWRLGILSLLIGLQALISSPLNTSDFRVIEEPLVVDTKKSQAPYAAFEALESHPSWSDSWVHLETEEKEVLEALTIQTSDQAVARAEESVLHIEEMTISKDDFAFAANDPETFSEAPLSRQWIKDLTPKQRDRMMQAHEKFGTLDEEWSISSSEDQIAQKFQEILETEKNLAQTSYHKHVFVEGAKPTSYSSGGRAQTQAAASSDYDSSSDRDVTPKNTDVASAEIGNFLVSGPVELSEGLAMTDQTHIELRRFEDGIAKETGHIDMRTGKYEIAVDQTLGVLVAKLVNSKGEVLGRGDYRLSRLPFGANQQRQIDQIKLRLSPITTGISAVALSADSLSNRPTQPKIVAKNVEVTLESLEQNIKVEPSMGRFGFSDLSANSNVIAQLNAQGYAPALANFASGVESETFLFSNEKIESFYSLLKETHEFTDLEDGGNLVWGRVVQNGKPVAGIEISLEGYDDIKPVFINELGLPDTKLKATTGTGVFVFVDLAEGLQAFRATKGHAHLGHINLIVGSGFTTYGEVEIGAPQDHVTVKVFDAFNGDPQEANLILQSFEDEVSVDTSGIKTISLPQTNRLSIALADPQDPYADAQYFYNDKDDFVHIPLINADWIQSIRQGMRLDDATDVGIVVGFVADDFEVFLSNNNEYKPENILFFDATGRRVQRGVAGGGFVLFNVPYGIQSVVVIPSQSDQIESRITVADPSRISVLQFNANH